MTRQDLTGMTQEELEGLYHRLYRCQLDQARDGYSSTYYHWYIGDSGSACDRDYEAVCAELRRRREMA